MRKRNISGTRTAVAGIAASIPLALAGVLIAVATSEPGSVWGNVWTWVAIGCVALAVLLAAVVLLTAPAERAQPQTLEDEAADLARELLTFYEPWAKALPPLEYVQVGAPTGAMETWEANRDATILAEYHRVFADRVVRVYEALRDQRGYGHPQMEGRYDNVRMAGEVFTISRALGQMVGVDISMAH